MTEVVTRFAPSPTGLLHLGHAYSAMLAHDFARQRGGAFLLRIEDIDPGRARDDYVAAIHTDLAWLGLDWDGEPMVQSRRLAVYAASLDRLKDEGLVYPCFCTRSAIAAEIARSAAAPHGPDGPIYPGTCQRLEPAEVAVLQKETPHAWRLDVRKALERLDGKALGWSDSRAGWVEARPELFGDVVLARKDAPTSYHLAVTIDDAVQGVTDVLRGRDLFDATHVHLLLQALLGLPTPRYHHHALLIDAEGRRLAKRHGAPSLASLRQSGADPAALMAGLRTGQMPAGYLTAPS